MFTVDVKQQNNNNNNKSHLYHDIQCRSCTCKGYLYLSLKALKMKIVKFANSVDADEVAHNELPRLDLHCLLSLIGILNMIMR